MDVLKFTQKDLQKIPNNQIEKEKEREFIHEIMFLIYDLIPLRRPVVLTICI